MQLQMNLTCPVCSSKNINKSKLSGLKTYEDHCFDLMHCNHCDLEFWIPLKIIPEVYSDEYLDNYKDIHSGNTGLGINMNLFISNNSNSNGSLIDIGCGNGLFINEMRSRGFDVKGVDLDEKSVEYCKKLNLDVYNKNLEEFIVEHPEFNAAFDYITFFEVLEHQDNPLEFLTIAKGMLKPGGKIAFSVPDREKITTKMFKLYGRLLDPNKLIAITKRDFPPHHFLWLNRKVLSYLLRQAGFKKLTFMPIASTQDARIDLLKKALGHLNQTLPKFIPGIVFELLSRLPLGWNYSIYCEAKIE